MRSPTGTNGGHRGPTGDNEGPGGPELRFTEFESATQISVQKSRSIRPYQTRFGKLVVGIPVARVQHILAIMAYVIIPVMMNMQS